jgi:chemotaxis protein methyltransferase CheR
MMAGSNGRKSGSFEFGASLFALPDSSFRLLRDLIAERTGILFDEAKRSLLADKVSELVTANGLSSFLDYYYMLRYDSESDEHWNALINRLSVPETFFWRQSDQFETLSSIVAPNHYANDPRRPLRIWSAACCTGEEPVSIALALSLGGWLDRMTVEIRATDASPAMVERAKEGSYGERSFRQLPASLRSEYFESNGPERWRPHRALMKPIRYGVANLARRSDIELLADADVIFCRNVFIYFGDETIKDVVRVFSERMPADGCIFLGASESLTRLGVDLELAEIGKAFAYVKEGRRHIVEQWRSTPTGAGGGETRLPEHS